MSVRLRVVDRGRSRGEAVEWWGVFLDVDEVTRVVRDVMVIVFLWWNAG